MKSLPGFLCVLRTDNNLSYRNLAVIESTRTAVVLSPISIADPTVWKWNYVYLTISGAWFRQFQTLLFSMTITFIFTARCTSVQSAVLRSHVVCLSVCDVGEL